tara:strand:+ start:550 stop:975 length:426 start_codon:yes stop_codon:yes gene_type:complete
VINVLRRKIIFLFWGVLDAIYVLNYAFESSQSGKVPYYTDLLSTIDVLTVHGGAVATVMTLVSWLFQVSIIISAVMLLKGNVKAKLLCYIQIPFRLISIVPSVSVILIAASYMDGLDTIVILFLLAISEALKGYTLWKFKD